MGCGAQQQKKTSIVQDVKSDLKPSKYDFKTPVFVPKPGLKPTLPIPILESEKTQQSSTKLLTQEQQNRDQIAVTPKLLQQNDTNFLQRKTEDCIKIAPVQVIAQKINAESKNSHDNKIEERPLFSLAQKQTHDHYVQETVADLKIHDSICTEMRRDTGEMQVAFQITGTNENSVFAQRNKYDLNESNKFSQKGGVNMLMRQSDSQIGISATMNEEGEICGEIIDVVKEQQFKFYENKPNRLKMHLQKIVGNQDEHEFIKHCKKKSQKLNFDQFIQLNGQETVTEEDKLKIFKKYCKNKILEEEIVSQLVFMLEQEELIKQISVISLLQK
uniref:Uncharacterized protein n=1 Tax=Trepomonas sp. PC1 TaxID=1076344 RepID=A0A146JZV4_9EUKA|eukprot:JAP88941.1 Hypothetical protein TPC1_31564 [Trepomonas sp. PC1]